VLACVVEMSQTLRILDEVKKSAVFDMEFLFVFFRKQGRRDIASEL
jgi:hypothetical protein